jgi:molybdopterin biosynthesis enzyme
MIENLRAHSGWLRGSLGTIFPQRAIAFHDGTKVSRVRLTAGTQAMLATSAAALLGFGSYGIAQAAGYAVPAEDARAADGRVAQMERKVAAMRARGPDRASPEPAGRCADWRRRNPRDGARYPFH